MSASGDCVAFDEVAGIKFKDKDGIQIMKDYMASGSFARGRRKRPPAPPWYLWATSTKAWMCCSKHPVSLIIPPEMGTDTAFLDRIHCYIPGGRSRNSGLSILRMTTGLSPIIWPSSSVNCVKSSTGCSGQTFSLRLQPESTRYYSRQKNGRWPGKVDLSGR